jgi:hypothetical protein
MMNNKLIINGTEYFPKMLEWTSVISEEGESEGIIGIDCDVLQNGDLKSNPKNFHYNVIISFMIRNFGEGDGFNTDPKIHLWVKRSFNDEKKYDLDTVQEAKERAQVIWNDYCFEYIKRFFY